MNETKYYNVVVASLCDRENVFLIKLGISGFFEFFCGGGWEYSSYSNDLKKLIFC